MGSMKEEMEKVVNNKKQVAGLVLRLPTIKKVETVAKQEVIDRAVADIRQYLADIPGHMIELASRIQKIQKASPEERIVRSSELKALEDEVAAHLNADNEALRNAAKKAYEMAMFPVLADISVAELLAHKPGKAFLPVPDVDNGRRFLPGGVMLVESNGRVAKAVKASGGFQKIMEEIIKEEVFMPIYVLAFRNLNKPDKMSDEKFRLARILHAILRRGVAEAQARQEKEVVKERLENLS